MTMLYIHVCNIIHLLKIKFSNKWIEVEKKITPGDVTQTLKEKYCMVSFICGC